MPGSYARYSGSDPWVTGEVPTPTEMNNIGRSQREIGWGASPGSVTINYNQNHIAALGNLYFLATTGKIASPLTVSPGVGFKRFNGVLVADGATIALGNYIIGSNGILTIHCNDALTAGMVILQAGYNSVYPLLNPTGRIATSDTPGKLCILPNGDATYNLKNRLGSSLFFALEFLGF
jgi:hypothetical protein